MKKIILTGDRPTGPLHIGHYAGSLENRVKLQNEYQQFLMIADMQALTDNFDNPSKVRDNVLEILLDYLAVNIDPNKTTIFLQSQIPEIAELTMIFMNLVTIARLERNPTVKNEIKQKNFEISLPAGFFCYPISQAADIAIFLADLVPVGEDQLPMIEQTNEIVAKFNSIYHCDYLKKANALVGKAKRLPGVDGKNKMSKSLNNAIFLKDSNDEISKKIKMCYTDSEHLKIEQPGKIENNVVFAYLDAFAKDHTEIEALKKHYQAGGLGDSTLKKRLTEIMVELIEPIRKQREFYAHNLDQVREILKDGCVKARMVATQNFNKIKEIMGLNYFQ